MDMRPTHLHGAPGLEGPCSDSYSACLEILNFFLNQETPHFHFALGLADFVHEIDALLYMSTAL